MDNQNQANNQFGNQPKKDEPTADVSSSAPVEMEPATDNSAMPPSPTPMSGSTPVATPAQPPVQPVSSSPQPAAMPTQPEEEKKLEAGPQPQLLEAPKKKNPMLIAGIAIVLIIALAFLGMVVYNALY
jgi:hypothetical protein